jgi:hypothetical protein
MPFDGRYLPGDATSTPTLGAWGAALGFAPDGGCWATSIDRRWSVVSIEITSCRSWSIVPVAPASRAGGANR